MFDKNELLQTCKLKMGLGGPYFKVQTTDEDMMMIIDRITMPAFSRIYSNVHTIMGVRFTETDRLPNQPNMYKIPPSMTKELVDAKMDIIGIKDVGFQGSDGSVTSTPNGLLRAPTCMGLYTGMAMVSAAHNRQNLDMYRQHIKARFHHPDIVEFYNFKIQIETSDLALSFYTTFPENMMNVPVSVTYFLEQLALLDLKMFLWNREVKYMQGLQVGDGTIDLKVEDWAQAEADRKQLLVELRELSINDKHFVHSS